ncbi:efflux RND transporter periplasmic adaptor subunit [bacterium]|nr:efflux RND transporter periplasmic adaptor subunit [bacterium]
MKTIRSFSLLLFLGLLISGCEGGKFQNPSGTLEADEIHIASTQTARVLKVYVDQGQTVSMGDTLLLQDLELLSLQRAQTATNRKSIETQWQIAEEQISLAEESLSLIEKTYKRTKELHQNGNTSQQKLDEASTAFESAKRKLATAKHQLKSLNAESEKLDAALAVFDRQLEEGTVLAPVSGTVLLRAIEEGEVLRAGQTAFKIANLETMDLRVFVDMEMMDEMILGKEFAIRVDALGDKLLKSKISMVSDVAEFTPKNVQTRDARSQLVYAVTLRVDNPENKLHIGMPAEMILNRENVK